MSGEPTKAAPRSERLDYGWIIVGVLALTVTTSYGVLMYAFPVVLPAMQAELGWSQQTLTGAYSLGWLVGGVVALPMGRWLDAHGPREVMTGSAILASVLVAAWSQVDSRPAFYVIWIGLGACSAGLFYDPAFATVIQWFQHHRGRALTVVTVAGGLASTIFVPVTAGLMASLGWRAAVLVLAGLLAASTILPHAVALRRGPGNLALSVDGKYPALPAAGPARRAPVWTAGEALRSGPLRWLTTAFFFSTVASMAFAIHLIPLLLHRGHPIAVASLALGSLGVMKLIGRVLILPLSRRLSVATATVVMLMLQAAGVTVLLTSSSTFAVWTCVVAFGIGDGASTPARAELVAEFYGSSRYGTISGIVALFLSVARALGPVGASLVYAATGGYGTPLSLIAAMLAFSAWALTSTGRAATPKTALS